MDLHKNEGREGTEKLGTARLSARRLLIAWALSVPLLALWAGKAVSDYLENRENAAYLGKWKGIRSGDQIGFKERIEEPLPDAELMLDKKKAVLLLPLSVDNIPYGNHGGIYRWERKKCIILWCNACRHNIVMALKRKNDTMQLGMPNTLNSGGIGDKMIPSHSDFDYHYKPEIWLNYERVAQGSAIKK